MATKAQTKPSAPVVAVALPSSLEAIAHEIAGALHESITLSEALGELTIKAGKEIKKQPDMLAPFIDACRQLCDACGLTEGSLKVYLSNIRGVIRAMIVGYKPKAGQTLRSMYEAAPKGTGRQRAGTGARHSTDKPTRTASGASGDDGEGEDMDDGEKTAPAPISQAQKRKDATVALFGHYDDELAAALEWASKNELAFVRYVKANIAAAQSVKGSPVREELKKAA
jgi:hypothetical protein